MQKTLMMDSAYPGCIYRQFFLTLNYFSRLLITYSFYPDKNIMWYNSIKPLVKKYLDTRPAKALVKLAKDTLTSLWKDAVKPLWNAPFEWIASIDPVSSGTYA